MQSLSKLIRRLCWCFIVALALPASLAHAVMLRPEAVMPEQAASQADLDRAKVQQFLDRANVKERLQAMGVGGLNASDRVNALSEQEVHALAQRIDGMPAGGALSQLDIILIVLIALLVAIAV